MLSKKTIFMALFAAIFPLTLCAQNDTHSEVPIVVEKIGKEVGIPEGENPPSDDNEQKKEIPPSDDKEKIEEGKDDEVSIFPPRE